MVPRVARIRPANPSAHELGQQATVIDMGMGEQHGVDFGGTKRKGAVVQFLQGLLSLKQPAIDQETPGACLEEIAGARDGARCAAKPDGDAHWDGSASSPFNASTNSSSSAMALVKCGTLCVERIERIPDAAISSQAAPGNSACVTTTSMAVAPAAVSALAQAMMVPPDETMSSTISAGRPAMRAPS